MSRRDWLPPTRTLAIAGLVVAVIAGLWLHGRSRRHEVEERASAVASAIAGRPVQVRCPGPIHRKLFYEITEGSVRFGANGTPVDETKLGAKACDGLRRVLDKSVALDLNCLYYNCSKDDEQAALGLAVLAHESVHLKGVIDEGKTECEARTHVAFVATTLGLGDRAAQSVAHWQATDYAERLPDRYRAC